MSVHVKREDLARRSAASRRGAQVRKAREISPRIEAAEDFGPDSAHRGSDPVDGSIPAILARIRAYTEGRNP